jgi:hypothetical protein
MLKHFDEPATVSDEILVRWIKKRSAEEGERVKETKLGKGEGGKSSSERDEHIQRAVLLFPPSPRCREK